MDSPHRRAARCAGAALPAVVLALAFGLGPGLLEGRYNQVAGGAASAPSPRAQALHRRLTVADLHADTLLWDRSLGRRAGRGHVDLPRLAEGNVAVQGFTVVTKTPRGLNIQRNDDDSDNVTALAVLQLWPPRTWGSLLERALHQARRLREAAARSEGRLTLLLTREDLARHLERRGREKGVVAGFLGLEGAHALEGNPANLDRLFEAGFRMVALTHFFDTEWAGSAHGLDKGGLTAAGRDLVRRLEQRKILLDLAHASPRAVDEALALATRPVVVSHTGVKGTCDNPRNLSDAHLRAIAATGGVIGIGFWPEAVCGRDAAAIARAVRHAVTVAGVDHVALGSDWDGAVTVPFDAAGLATLTDALLAAGLGEEEVARVMGGNALRVLGEGLP